MLILTRKLGERIAIGEDIFVTILDIKGSHVKLGIEAPKHIVVHREEIYEKIREENIGSLAVSETDLSTADSLFQKFKIKRKSL